VNAHARPSTDRNNNPIEALASAIQALPAGVRWLHQQPEVIRAQACGMPVQQGPRTRRAERILSTANVHELARATACAGSFLLLVALYLRQRLTAPSKTLNPCLVVGVGALRERKIVADLEKERGTPVTLVNETSPAEFAGYFHVGWFALWAEWRGAARSAWSSLSDRNETQGGLGAHHLRLNFLLRAHLYAFARAWFRELKSRPQGSEPVVFTAASVIAYAGCSAGLRTVYCLHGFQRQSLVYPDFDEVVCFTQVEADHFARRLKNAAVRVQCEPGEKIDSVDAVAIAGAYGQAVGFEECAAFIAWAKARGYVVVLRPHPLDKSKFFEQWRADKDVMFSDTADSFDAFLEHVRPRLLLSWFSTALFDALRRGVVPVVVKTEAWRADDVVFPFEEISLHWPQDQATAEKFMEKEKSRNYFLASKRRFASIAEDGQ
jgi:hypothetical protein